MVSALVAVASATPHSLAIWRVEGTRSPGASSPSADAPPDLGDDAQIGRLPGCVRGLRHVLPPFGSVLVQRLAARTPRGRHDCPSTGHCISPVEALRVRAYIQLRVQRMIEASHEDRSHLRRRHRRTRPRLLAAPARLRDHRRRTRPGPAPRRPGGRHPRRRARRRRADGPAGAGATRTHPHARHVDARPRRQRDRPLHRGDLQQRPARQRRHRAAARRPVRMVHEHTRADVEYLFGDSITALDAGRRRRARRLRARPSRDVRPRGRRRRPALDRPAPGLRPGGTLRPPPRQLRVGLQRGQLPRPGQLADVAPRRRRRLRHHARPRQRRLRITFGFDSGPLAHDHRDVERSSGSSPTSSPSLRWEGPALAEGRRGRRPTSTSTPWPRSGWTAGRGAG